MGRQGSGVLNYFRALPPDPASQIPAAEAALDDIELRFVEIERDQERSTLRGPTSAYFAAMNKIGATVAAMAVNSLSATR